MKKLFAKNLIELPYCSHSAAHVNFWMQFLNICKVHATSNASKTCMPLRLEKMFAIKTSFKSFLKLLVKAVTLFRVFSRYCKAYYDPLHWK